jgi:hypothetical protein
MREIINLIIVTIIIVIIVTAIITTTTIIITIIRISVANTNLTICDRTYLPTSFAFFPLFIIRTQ